LPDSFRILYGAEQAIAEAWFQPEIPFVAETVIEAGAQGG
jgi:hypothetical protein